jgi:hypothetical protein
MVSIPARVKTKDYNIGICNSSAKYALLRNKRNKLITRNHDNEFKKGATCICLYVNCCFKLAATTMSKSRRVGLVQDQHQYHFCEKKVIDIAEKLNTWC